MNTRGVIMLVALMLLIGGCASNPTTESTVGVSESEPSSNPFSSAFPENQAGLEIQWWTVSNRSDALAQALAPYANEPTPLPPTVQANWRRNGMRMVRVPVENMQGLLTSLPIEDKVNRIWLGQALGWTIAAPGQPWGGSRMLLIDGETIRLGAGQLRLLVRAWISPTEGPPTLRTDLALQYLDMALSNSTQTPFDRASLRRPETEGMIFRTLTAPLELSGNYAYCIVSEDPDVDWAELTLPDDDKGEPDAAETVPTLPERAPEPYLEFDPDSRSPDDVFELGPKPAGIPLLADALLSKVDLFPTRRRSRTIVILAPVIPGAYSLAPAVSSSSFNTSR